MIDGKTFRQGLDKFFKSPTCQGARVQIELPNGEMYDITGAKLLENRILGSNFRIMAVEVKYDGREINTKEDL